MKQKLNIMALMAIVMTLLFSQTAKAEDVMYATLTNNQTVLTFYFGEKPTSVEEGYVYNVPKTSQNYLGWHIYNSPITTVVFDRSFENASPTSCHRWFYECKKLETITGIENLHTDNVTDMSEMFYSCQKLGSLDVSKFNTDNVTNMSHMFYRCSKLTLLDVSKFNTANVTDMSSMFSSCSVLTDLDVTNFNTEKVTNMSGMFSSCNKLESINISSFKTDIVTDMSYMFSSCYVLTSLDVSKLNTKEVTNMSCMFNGCSGLTDLKVSNFNTEKVTNVSSMFNGCSRLTDLDVTNFNTKKVTNMSSMFSGCSGLTTIDLSNFNTNIVTNMSSMFSGCSGLTTIDLSNFNTNIVTNMSSMFSGCSGLTTIDLSNFNTEKVTDMTSMFRACTGLTSLELRNFNTNIVTNMREMFSGCSGLTSLDVSNFNTAKVENMYYMFNGCSGLTSLDLTSFNTGMVKNMGYMFYRCMRLITIYVSNNFVTDQVTSSDNMFYYCQNLDGAIKFILGTTNVFDKTNANYKTGFFKTYCKVGDTLYDMCGEELKVDDLALIDGKDFVAHAPFKATNVSYTRTISTSAPKWGSLCLPFKYTPSDFEAYQLTSSDDANNTITLEKIEGPIAAGTPVLFKNPTERTSLDISATDANIVALPVEGTATEPGNLKLVGTYQAKTFTKDDINCFILKDDKLMNTKKLLSNVNVSKVGLNAYRAYMVNETPSPAPQTYSIETGEGTTVINSLNIMTGEGAEYYDMTGCRTNGLKKGLNIVRQGGKTMKIIIK